MDKESYEGAKRVLWITLFLNVVVVLFKLIFGIMISSLAMIADGLHSLLDGASNVVCLVGLRISAKPADRSHPYGHRKFETLTTIIIAMFLLLASLELLRKSLERFRGAVTPQITMGAFAVLVLTLAVNIFVSYYERKKGEQYGSRVLIADSLHTSSDVWVTISVIIGFVVIKAGYPFVDPVLAIVIAVVIGYSGIGIIRDTTTVLCDSSAIHEREIRRVLKGISGITGLHKIRTRSVGDETFVDLHLMTKGDSTVRQGHRLAKRVEEIVKKEYPHVKDVTIHVDPTHKVVKP